VDAGVHAGPALVDRRTVQPQARDQQRPSPWT
jgi:hypothetical protein